MTSAINFTGNLLSELSIWRAAPWTAQKALTAVGGLYVASHVLSLARFFYVNHLCSSSIKKSYAAAGSWAVVTGGSEGIGFSMACELARQGMNVIIIALDEPLLFRAAQMLQTQYPSVQVDAIPFNFLTSSDADFDALFKKLDTREVAVLVNNVGGFYKYPKPLDVASLGEDLRLLKLNCEPQIRMTKHFLPRWKALRCGAIVNLASFSALVPAPYMTTYAGTKAFNLAFSRSLEAEVREFGIDVLAVTPLIVSTRITQFYEDAPMQPGENGAVDARVMARNTLAKLGVVSETCGHRLHDWIGFVYPKVGWMVGGRFLAMVKESFAKSKAMEVEKLRSA